MDMNVETPAIPAAVVLALIVATICGAFAFQAAGYAPCELCLKERLPFYAGLPLAVATFAIVTLEIGTLEIGTWTLGWRGQKLAARLGFGLLVALFLFSAGFGTYHAGVEWGFWPGPSDCTGTLDRATTNTDFLHQLQTVRVVRCDAVAIRILGLSLAGWNALISFAIAGTALLGLSRSR